LAWPSPSGPLGRQRGQPGQCAAGTGECDLSPADASYVRRSFRKIVAAAGWTLGSGLPANCGTASSRCSPTPRSPSSRSRDWSATAARPRRRLYMGSRSGRCSCTGLTSWTGSSRMGRTWVLSYSPPAISRSLPGRMPLIWSGWPDLNRRPLRPELAALLGVWPSSQLAECAAGGGCWRLCGCVAVLPCCTVYRISSSDRAHPNRFRLDQRA
jgi:hypothetical protein